MTNKLYDSKGQLIGYIRTVEKNQHDDLVKVILSTGHELVFGPCDLTSDRDGNWRIRSGALYHRCEGKKTDSATNTAAIKDVIFAPPATIVYWSDGSKTVVKCSEKFLSAVMSNNQSGILLHLTALVADLKILENEINK